jgi:tellurium resistance protein TerD
MGLCASLPQSNVDDAPPVQLNQIDVRCTPPCLGITTAPPDGCFEVRVTWDEAKDASTVDIDLGALLFDKAGRFLDAVYHAKRTYCDGAIVHDGDNVNGHEQLSIHVDLLSDEVGCVVPFLLARSPQHTLADATSSSIRVVTYNGQEWHLDGDKADPQWALEAARADVEMRQSDIPCIRGMLLGRVFRASRKWCYQAKRTYMPGARTHESLIPLAQETVLRDLPGQEVVMILRNHKVLLLEKGESTPLRSGLAHITIGLGWDEIPQSFGNINPDVSCVLWHNKAQRVEFVDLDSRSSACGYVSHSGDYPHDRRDGDDEQIAVTLDCLDSNITQLFITLTSFDGRPLSSISAMFVRITDTITGHDIVRYDMGPGRMVAPRGETGLVVCSLTRDTSRGWTMHAIGKPVANAKTCADCVSHLA